MVRAAGEKHQAAALTPVGGVKMTESLKEDQRRRNDNKWGVAGKAGLDILIGAVSVWGGPSGWLVGGIYFIGDSAGWWGNCGQPAPSTQIDVNRD